MAKPVKQIKARLRDDVHADVASYAEDKGISLNAALNELAAKGARDQEATRNRREGCVTDFDAALLTRTIARELVIAPGESADERLRLEMLRMAAAINAGRRMSAGELIAEAQSLVAFVHCVGLVIPDEVREAVG